MTAYFFTGLGQVMRCSTRPAAVQAVRHVAGRSDLAAWVAGFSVDPRVICEPGRDGSVIVCEHAFVAARSTVVQPGDLVVEVPGGRFGWDAYDLASFRRRYMWTPRKVPVFNDGELV